MNAHAGSSRRAAAVADVATSAPDVSVIVVNWNTVAHLRRCLASIYRETRDVGFEVIVVDNASADASVAMVSAEFPQATLIANETNRGFAAANNQAMRIARGRYFLLLNPDTQVIDDAVGRAVRAAESDRTIGALGCQVLVSDGEIQRTCFRFPSVFGLFLLSTGLHKIAPRRWFHGGPAMRDWDRRTARDVDVVSGMFLLVRRAALDETGPMDEAYFVYAEEADLCFRLRRAGWRCVFSPCARILHEDGGGKSTEQDPVRMYVQLQKSILVFHRKNLGRASWLAAKAIYVASSACRAAFWRALSLVVKSDAVRDRGRCAAAALRFHLFGREPRR